MTTNEYMNKLSNNDIDELHKQIQYEKNNILIIQLRGLGDFICVTPVLKTLHDLEPDANIIFLCYTDIKDLIEDYPYIDKVIFINDYIKNIDLKNINYLKLLPLIEELLYNGFINMAINISSDLHELANIILYLSAAKIRIANNAVSNDINCELINRNLLTDILNIPNMHMIDKNMYFLEYLYKTKFHPELEWIINDKDFINIKEKIIFLIGSILYGSTNICIGTGAASPSRRYSYYYKLITELNKIYNHIYFHIIGDEKINLPNCINYDVTIKQVISIISQCDLYIGNDTCYPHFAAIFKIPCIVLYKESEDKYHYYSTHNLSELTIYDNWYPYNTPHIPIRPNHSKFPCNKQQYVPSGCRIDKPHCINNIKIDDIIKAVKVFLPV